jgi:hypothetical protein
MLACAILGVVLSLYRYGNLPFCSRGDPKWLGRLQRSSKCRSAWKSTCTPARLANKRRRTLPIPWRWTAGRDEVPAAGTERDSGGHLRNFLGFRRQMVAAVPVGRAGHYAPDGMAICPFHRTARVNHSEDPRIKPRLQSAQDAGLTEVFRLLPLQNLEN